MNTIDLYEFPINIPVWMSSASVQLMTLAERMGYLNLLFHCFRNGGRLPDDDDKLAVLSELREDWKKGAGVKIRSCFYKNRQSQLRNKRVDFLIKRIETHQTKSRQGGLASAKARQEKKLGQNEAGKGGCNQVASKNEVDLGLGGNLNPSNKDIYIYGNKRHNHNKDCNPHRAADAGGGADCFDLKNKKLPEEILAARQKAAAVLIDRLRPLNGTAKVIEDILNAGVRRAVKTGEVAVFDRMAEAARRIVADDTVTNPAGKFVAWAKKAVGYVPAGPRKGAGHAAH